MHMHRDFDPAVAALPIAITGYLDAQDEIYWTRQWSERHFVQLQAPSPTSDYAGAILLRNAPLADVIGAGAAIIYGSSHSDIDDVLGQRALIGVMDGRAFVRRLRRGNAPCLYIVEGDACNPLENVLIEWVAPILRLVDGLT